MSLIGTSRHFAATQHLGRFWGEEDINRQTKPAGSVENDPERTSRPERNLRLGDEFILGQIPPRLRGRAMEHLRYPHESAEYRAARNALLNDEIALRAQIEAVAAKRRALPPGGEVPEDYIFERIGKTSMPEGQNV
jgi:Bacterial protein of unknown function (DUF899)